MNIIIALLVLSVIVIIHELGHFILAKANGVGVKEFAIGMGPRVAQIKKGETVYCIKLLPFGGSCMMVGEDENSDDEKAFNNKSVWARISIIAAGPVFNFILAFILALIIIGNIGYDPCMVYSVKEGSAAYEAGLMEGDRIVQVNNRSITFFREFYLYETVYPDRTMEITYERDGQYYTTTVVPEYVEADNYQVGMTITGTEVTSVIEGAPAQVAGLLAKDIIQTVNGVEVQTSDEIIELVRATTEGKVALEVLRGEETLVINVEPKLVHTTGYETGLYCSGVRVATTPMETVRYSFTEVKYWIVTVFDSLRMMFTGRVSADDVAGPVGVVSLIGDVVEESKSEGSFYILLNVLNMTMMISANLGVMNLLPLPALDGGRLVFLIIEAIRRKPIDREKEGMVHFVGIVLLMILMVFVSFNDIRNLFH